MLVFFGILTRLRKKVVILFSLFFIIFGLFSSVTLISSQISAATSGNIWYVSKNGNNADGKSWATAWNELNQINWSQIQPGDTINIDGGTTSMTYTSTLTVGVSGTSSLPIIIRLSTDSGRNGQAIIFGGRTTPLPYCDQVGYVYQTQGVRTVGIDFGSSSYVLVDGTKWRGIVVTGHDDNGVKLSGSYNTLRFAEVYDNGTAVFNANQNTWRPDRPGISPSGTNNTLDHDIIHDNGQDALQTGNTVTNMKITYDWHYNSRTHPQYGPAVAFNYCTHSDGFQIYSNQASSTTAVSSGISFDHTILGPGFMQGTLLGQAASGSQGVAQVNNVSFSNVLVIGDFNAGIMGYATTNPTGWRIDHVTIYTARSPNWNISSGTGGPGNVVGTGWNESFNLDGSNHQFNGMGWKNSSPIRYYVIK